MALTIEALRQGEVDYDIDSGQAEQIVQLPESRSEMEALAHKAFSLDPGLQIAW